MSNTKHHHTTLECKLQVAIARVLHVINSVISLSACVFRLCKQVRVKCAYGKFSINASSTTTLDELDFSSLSYCLLSTAALKCKNPYGERFSETVFLGPPTAVARVLNGLQYWSYIPNKKDECSVTVYDGADGDCLALAMLEERRDGSHSSDSSSDVSVYARDGSGGGDVQCYAPNVTWTVDVGDYPYRHWCQSAIGICFTLQVHTRLKASRTIDVSSAQ